MASATITTGRDKFKKSIKFSFKPKKYINPFDFSIRLFVEIFELLDLVVILDRISNFLITCGETIISRLFANFNPPPPLVIISKGFNRKNKKFAGSSKDAPSCDNKE